MKLTLQVQQLSGQPKTGGTQQEATRMRKEVSHYIFVFFFYVFFSHTVLVFSSSYKIIPPLSRRCVQALGGRYERGQKKSEQIAKLVKQPLEEKRSKKRGVKRKSDDFVDDPVKEERAKDGTVRKEIDGGAIQPFEEKRSEDRQVKRKSEVMISPDLLSEHGDLKQEEPDTMEDTENPTNNGTEKSAQQHSGNKTENIPKIKNSLLSKLLEGMVATSKEFLNPLIKMELEEMSAEDRKVGKESGGVVIQSLEEMKSEARQVKKKSEDMMSPDMFLDHGDLKHKKLMEAVVGNSTEYLNPLIQLEFKEIEVIKSEDCSEEVLIEDIARDEVKLQHVLKESKAIKNSERMEIIGRDKIDTKITETIALSTVPSQSGYENWVKQKHQNMSPVQNKGEGGKEITGLYEIKVEGDNEVKHIFQPEETVDILFDETDYEDPADTVTKDLENKTRNKANKEIEENSFLAYLEFLDSLNTSLEPKDIETAQKNYAIRSISLGCK